MNINSAEVIELFSGLVTFYGIIGLVCLGFIATVRLGPKVFSWPIWDQVSGAVGFVFRYAFRPVVLMGINLRSFLNRSVPPILGFLGEYLPKVVAILAAVCGPWLVIGWMLTQWGVPMGRILSLGIASSMLALPICFIAWPVLQRLDKQPLKLSHVPLVFSAAVFWLAPILLLFPMMGASG